MPPMPCTPKASSESSYFNACLSEVAAKKHPVRRRWYGLPGEFRVNPHGCEFRPLSNAWLYNPKCAEMIFDFAQQVVNATLAGKLNLEISAEEVIEPIILCSVDQARGFMERHADTLKQFKIKNDIDLMKPAEAQMDMVNIEKNWGLSA